MKIKDNISRIALVVSNLVPLFGVIFWKWDLSSIIFIYWLENLIIGLLNILKIKKAEGKILPGESKGFSSNGKSIEITTKSAFISFFIVHYGMFTMIHGIFVLAIFGLPKMSFIFLLSAFLSILVSHFISYKVNFIGKGEYLNVSPAKLFNQPYSRVIILHVTVILGALLTRIFGSPISALVLMVILKIIVDLWLHNKERKKFKPVIMNSSNN